MILQAAGQRICLVAQGVSQPFRLRNVSCSTQGGAPLRVALPWAKISQPCRLKGRSFVPGSKATVILRGWRSGATTNWANWPVAVMSRAHSVVGRERCAYSL